jgi:3',5'-cyclic AMP phosphodiesterase CpdA
MTSGFTLAFTYLRGRLYTGGQRERWLGLGVEELPVIPGNHDAWRGAFPGFGLIGWPRRGREAIEQFFHPPAAGAAYAHRGQFFPYRVRMHPGDNQSPPIYLYGLDSTGLDPNWIGTLHDTLAFGNVGAQQLVDLENLCQGEPPGPSIRIAAVHHPLVYPGGKNPPRLRTLLDRDDVVAKLQELGFCLALCGHQHEGFTFPKPNPNGAPLHVLSAGTATQAIRKPPFYQRGDTPNHFGVYDFLSLQRNPAEIRVVAREVVTDVNDDNQTSFNEKARSTIIRLNLQEYDLPPHGPAPPARARPAESQAGPEL